LVHNSKYKDTVSLLSVEFVVHLDSGMMRRGSSGRPKKEENSN